MVYSLFPGKGHSFVFYFLFSVVFCAWGNQLQCPPGLLFDSQAQGCQVG